MRATYRVYQPEHMPNFEQRDLGQRTTLSMSTASFLHRETGFVDRGARERRLGARACTYWITGLSGSGKSTIAAGLERQLVREQIVVYPLDGDNLRHGLNKGLGFSPAERSENIRRVAEVARLFNDAGVSVICSLISPMASDREAARQIVGSQSFFEIHLSTPLEVCEQRDPHGLYKRARAGEIPQFTGVGSVYEVPLKPEIRIDTSTSSIEESVQKILSFSIGYHLPEDFKGARAPL